MKKILLLALSLSVTGLLVYYLLTRSHWSDWQRIIFQLNPLYLLGYLMLYLGGLLLRTFRYQLLLKSAHSSVLPTFSNLLLVTGVRNMLVDFLPARTGSLSYIVLLNRAFKVDLSPCLSSFAYAFLFDLMAMAPLLGLAILVESQLSHKSYPWLWVIALLIMLVALILILSLGPLIKLLAKWSGQTSGHWGKHPWLEKMDQQIQNIGYSFLTIREKGIFWPTVGLSLMIRGLKYLSLYLLLWTVLQALYGAGYYLPFWMVLLGLIGSEAAAGLPVSGIAGFGFYEGVLGSILSTQGIPSSQAVLVSFAMHLLTQVVDYSLGSGALLYIVFRVLKKKSQ